MRLLFAAVLVASCAGVALSAQSPAAAPGQTAPTPGQVPGSGRGTTQPQPGSTRAPARDNPKPDEKGTAVLRGQVVASDSGTPIRRAQVRLSGIGMRESRLATTDAQGRFEIRDLNGGRYSLTASKGG
ncbi:MAG TPA: carboxypeptidase-like regulatory domain-containing protein, partial [Vicinamibacterales bacterium]|nr:carboxypeptidase-like regulatory domain-containing protein [Vicinamibacterales bacterium]